MCWGSITLLAREYRIVEVGGEYGDPWCIMSAESFGGRVVTVDPAIAGFGRGQHNKGPGLNGGTRAFFNWAPTVDLVLGPQFNWTGTLDSLSRAPSTGDKVVRVQVGDNNYTLEFRSPADDCDRGLPCPLVLVHHQAGSSADRTYPHKGCATLLHEIRAGGPGVIETAAGLRVRVGPMSRDGRQVRVQVSVGARPYAPWFPIDAQKRFSGRAPAAAVARRADQLDLFCVGQGGIVRSAWWSADAGWNNWFDLDFGRRFAENAPITALARRPDHLDLFVTDGDGVTTSAWYHDPTPEEIEAKVWPWRPWFSIGPDVHFRQDRPVAAVARMPEQIDLFRIGFDGAVYGTWWQPDAEGWRRWYMLHGETRFPSDSYVTAIARRPDHLDLFAVGPNNAVWSCYWHADAENWRPWFPLFPQWTFRADQPIAAVARRPEHIDLFAMGYDGSVWTAWWDSASGWHEWYPVRPELHFDPQATVTAVARRPDHMDLYVKAADGVVWSTYYHEDAEGWRPWYSIHPEVRFAPARPLAALSRYAEQLDVFEIDAAGAVVSTYWPGFAPDAPPPDVRHAIYHIDAGGHLTWMRHEDAWNGGGKETWVQNRVGSGWNRFRRVFAGGQGIVYAMMENGDLYWYKHFGYADGAPNWAPAQKVGTGWQVFKHVFSDRQGHIYAITAQGELLWYDHLGRQDGSFNWSGSWRSRSCVDTCNRAGPAMY